MIDKKDKEISEWLSQLGEVPFRDTLKARILEAALTESASPKRRQQGIRRQTWRRLFAAGGGAVAALLILAVGLVQYHTRQELSTATTVHIPFNAQASQFGLQNAPIQISNMHIGTHPGDPKNGDVLAQLKNTSQSVISSANLFGVIAFTRADASQENWLTFVNGPSQTIQPGQTVDWWFHPSGLALLKSGTDELAEKPHLQFYSAKLVRPDQASTVWQRSALEIRDIQVQPMALGKQVQSVRIHAQIRNTTGQSIDLASERAIIWFASTPSQSFLSNQSIRFLYHLTPETVSQSWPTTIQSGHTVAVSFDVLSNVKSDFFSRTPHILIIHAPHLPS